MKIKSLVRNHKVHKKKDNHWSKRTEPHLNQIKKERITINKKT